MEDYSEALKSQGISPAAFQLSGTGYPFTLSSFSFFRMEMSKIVTLCFFYDCILRAGKLLVSFTGPQREKDFVPG